MSFYSRSIVVAAVVPVTSDDTAVQLVSDPTEEFCDASLYCDFNVSNVSGVQLQVMSASGHWLTVYSSNTTANNQSSTTQQLAVSYRMQIAESYRIGKLTTIHH